MMDNKKSDVDIKSCVTDRPLGSLANDQLSTTGYAQALANFIQDAETPVIIGVQGNWGSGKTSLIYALREKLEEDTEHNTLVIFVNAWEHSLFHESGDKAEVTISLLRGLMDGLKEAISDNINLKDNKKDNENGNKKSWVKIDPQAVENKSELLNKSLGFIKIAARVGTQMFSNMVGGGDVSAVMKNTEKAAESAGSFPPLAKIVHELNKELAEMVIGATDHGKLGKIIFFIDDLDRVPPPTAVQILDITKNIFEIPHCVFVLAIDYEVVVRGLEDKFGKRDGKNEREFRQYFDKIIQIPFSMPVGVYADHLIKLIEPVLKRLNYENVENDKKLLTKLADVAKLSTGGNPRSLKRILNTLSLLSYIDKAARGETSQLESQIKFLLPRFIIVALHISFPEICIRLMEKPDFTDWKPMELDRHWNLKFEKNKKDLEAIKEDEYFDEDWEKVIYCLCATKSEWLKTQAKSVSRLFNMLRDALTKKGDKDIDDDGRQILNEVLKSIRVVSIDSASTLRGIDEDDPKNDSISAFCRKLHKKLDEQLPDAGFKGIDPDEIYAEKKNGRTYTTALKGSVVNRFTINWKNKKLSIQFFSPCDDEDIDIDNFVNNVPENVEIEAEENYLQCSQAKEGVIRGAFSEKALLDECVNGAQYLYKLTQQIQEKNNS